MTWRIWTKIPKNGDVTTVGHSFEINAKIIDSMNAANWKIDSMNNGGNIVDASDGGGVIFTCNSVTTTLLVYLDMPLDLRNKMVVLKARTFDTNLSEVDFYWYCGPKVNQKFWQGMRQSDGLGDVYARDTYIALHPFCFFSNPGMYGGGVYSDLADFRRLGIRVRLSPGQTQTQLQIYEIKVLDAIPAPGAISIIFDDGWLCQYTKGYAKMKQYNMPGNIGVITQHIGSSNMCTLAQLTEMYNAGWDMVSHTQNHVTLAGQSLATIQSELRGSQQDLADIGFLRSHKYLVYPGLSYDNQAINEAKKLYHSARSGNIWWGSWPILGDNKYHYGSFQYVFNTTGLATLKNAVDVVKQFGGHGIFTFHYITDGPIPDSCATGFPSFPLPAQYQYLTSDFNSFIDYVAASGIPVVRLSDVFGGSIPAVY